MKTVRHPARQGIGLVLAALAGIGGIINLLWSLSGPPVNLVAGVAVPAALLVLFLASSRVEAGFSYRVQALVPLGAGLACAALGGTGQLAALPLLLLGGLLLWRYRLVRPTRPALGLALLLPAPLFMAGGLSSHRPGDALVVLVLYWALAAAVRLTLAADLRRSGQEADRGSILARLGETSAGSATAALQHLEMLRKRLAGLPGGDSPGAIAVSQALALLEADLRGLDTQTQASARMLREKRDPGGIVTAVLETNARLPAFERLVRFEADIEPASLDLAPQDFREAVNTLVRSAGEAVLATGRAGTVRVSCNARALVVEDQGRPGSGQADLLVWDFCRSHDFGLRYASLPGGGSRATIDFAAALAKAATHG